MSIISQQTSDKIKLLSLVSIILVLYIHSSFHQTPNEIQGMPFNLYLQKVISGFLGGAAVPMFYTISGFLFFQKADNINDVIRKIRKRVHTLLIPFIIAAIFMPLFIIAVELMPGAGDYMNGGGTLDYFRSQSILSVLQLLFCKPFAFHLWFLRDLIVIVALSPLLFYFWKFANRIFMAGIIFLMMISLLQEIPFVSQSLFWFMAGALTLQYFNRIGIVIPVLVVVCYELLTSCAGLPYLDRLLSIMKAIKVIAIWNLYDAVVPATFQLKKHKWLAMACSFTFFIYLFHEPTLNVVRKILIVALGRTPAGFAINYIVSPWIFAVMAIFMGILVKKYASNLYSVLVGGR